MCLGVFLLGSDLLGLSELPGLPGSLFPLPDWGTIFIIFSNKFSMSCSSSSPSGTPMIQMLECLKLSQSFLSLSSYFLNSCFFILFWLNFCFFILFWLNIYCFFLLQIIDLSPGFLPFTVGSLCFFFISRFIAFTFSSIQQLYSTTSVSMLITSVLNCASDRWALSLSHSCIFSGALMCSFIWAIFPSLGAPVTL